MNEVANALVAGYRRQLGLFEGLLRLAREEAGDEGAAAGAGAALARLREKARVLSEAGEVDASLAPWKARWAASHAGARPEEVSELNGLLDAIARVLSEALAIEDEGRRRFALVEGILAGRAPEVPASRAARYALPPSGETVSVRG